MPFPIYYNGQILFRNGRPAMSLDCCCDGRPQNPTRCCGETIEVEYQVYDQSNTTLLFEGSFQWPLEGAWVTEPQTREGEGVLSIEDGSYKIEQGSKPVAVCVTTVADGRFMTVDALIGSMFDGIVYDTQNAFGQFACDALGTWSLWTQSPGQTRYRIRLLE